jgi:hypothetical protein
MSTLLLKNFSPNTTNFQFVRFVFLEFMQRFLNELLRGKRGGQ